PQIAAASDLDQDGFFEIIADEHGELRIYSDAGVVLGIDKDWPPAYTTPIVMEAGQGSRILRSNGIQGISMVDAKASPVWQIKVGKEQTWRYYKSVAAVGNVA